MTGISGIRPRHVALALLVVAIVLYSVAPLVSVIGSSFDSTSNVSFPPSGFSLRWYTHLFHLSSFRSAAIFSIWLGIASAIVALACGTLAGYALVRMKGRGTRLFQMLFLSPLVVPKIVFGVGVFVLLVRVHVYGNPVALVLAHATISLPFVVILLSAAFATTDPSLEEAARDLGSGVIRIAVRVLYPQIRVPLLMSGIFAFINSFDQVESTIFLTRPGSTTLPIAIYNYLLEYQDPTVAALSSLTVGFSVVLAAALVILMRSGRYSGLKTLAATQ